MLVLWKIWNGMIGKIACMSFLKILGFAINVCLFQFDRSVVFLGFYMYFCIMRIHVADFDVLMASLILIGTKVQLRIHVLMYFYLASP